MAADGHLQAMKRSPFLIEVALFENVFTPWLCRVFYSFLQSFTLLYSLILCYL